MGQDDDGKLAPAQSGLIATRSVLAHLEGVTKDYRMGNVDSRALRGITLDLYRGEFVVVLGPSGSGKTTLLNLLGGIDTATQGQIVVNGHDISRFSDSELTAYRRHTVGFVFQFFNLIPTLTALRTLNSPPNSFRITRTRERYLMMSA